MGKIGKLKGKEGGFAMLPPLVSSEEEEEEEKEGERTISRGLEGGMGGYVECSLRGAMLFRSVFARKGGR